MDEKRHVKKEAHKKAEKHVMKQATDIHAYVLSAIIVIFLAIMLVNLAQTFFISKALQPKEAIELKVTLLSDVNCADCADLSPLVKVIGQYGKVESVKLDKSSSEAQDLIKKYGIEALPNVVITGNFDKEPKIKADLAALGVIEKNKALVLTKIPAPFYDLKSGTLKGLVDVIVLEDASCTVCTDMKNIVTQLKQVIKVSSDRTIDVSSAEGKALVSKYKIKSVPTLIFSEDALLYPNIEQEWKSVGTVESDGSLVMRQLAPPYRDLSTNTVKGLVKLTMLTDKSCSNCYNVTMHKQALATIGITKFSEEKTLDISSAEGKALVTKYKINAVPTIVLAGDLEPYKQLVQVWASVGTVETDGAYVFRNMQAIKGAVYKDLANDTIVS